VTWKILLFETSRGEKPVERFINSLNSNTTAKVIHSTDLLEKHGNLLRMPHSKRLVKGLYELRVKGKEEIRIMYTYRSRNIYLLHAFKKKSQKTPKREMATALKRIDMI
jgi:phage-related protein